MATWFNRDLSPLESVPSLIIEIVAGGQEQPDQPASEADEAFLRLTTSGHANPLMSAT